MNTIKRTYRIFIKAIIITAIIIAVKYLLHANGLEIIVLGSLHGSVISGVIFVIGFILSTTISDYKEAERIPAEIASTLEDMNEDVIAIHDNYPKFDVKGYQAQLKKVASSLAGDLRSSKSDTAKNSPSSFNLRSCLSRYNNSRRFFTLLIPTPFS